MPLIPIPTQVKLKTSAKLKNDRQRKGRLVKSAKSPEVRYRNALLSITNDLKQATNATLIPLLKRLEPEFVADSYAERLEAMFEALRKRFENADAHAKVIAKSFTGDVEEKNRRRFNESMKSVVGVNLSTIVQNEGLQDILVGATRQNVALIKSIPEEYFKRLEVLVFNATTQGNTVGSMISEIINIYGVTERRAKLIARDQTSKLNGVINKQRQTNLGITEYIWRTAGDDRVRDSHVENNGKTFKWSDPPSTGHPGSEISCRCVAQGIINI